MFLALAVGIILGAGPLKDTIGNELTGQVDQLREEKDAIRNVLEVKERSNANLNDYIAASSKRVAKNTLPNRRIAVIQTGEVSDEVYDKVEQQLTYAGATVTARLSLGQAWTAADQADARQSYATSLTEYVPEDKKELQADKLLASALMVALSEKSAVSADEMSANAGLALDILDGADLIDLVKYTPTPVDAVVMIDASNVLPDDATDAPDFSAASALQLNVAEAAARQTEGVVVSTATVVETDLVTTIRENASSLKLIATVSDVDEPVGALNTPLALSAAIGGKFGHFGFESNATALVPAAVVLPEPDRTVTGVEPTEQQNSDEDNGN